MKSNKEIALSEIDQELRELAQKIGSEDFSQVSHKEEVRTKVLKNIREKEGDNMKKSYTFKKHGVAVASLIVATTLFAQTAIAKDMTQKIVEIFSLGNGHINIVKEEPIKREANPPLPDSLKGKLFDGKGNEIKAFSEDITKLYTKAGEEIAYIGEGDVIVTQAQMEAEQAETTLVVEDINKRNDYTCFDVKIPHYLPEGYQFDRIEFYKDESGKVEESKYIDIFYTHEKTGEFIYMQQRLADEETGYTTGTEGTVEKVKVNGVEALVMDDRSIDWEADGVLYSLTGRGAFGKEELLKIAGSIK